MLIAIDKNGKLIFSEDALKNTLYYCAHCNEKMIFKKGPKKIPYFSHMPNSACLFKSEHHNHRYFKWFCLKNLNTLLQKKYTITIEKPFKIFNEHRIADVIIKELRIILEFQHSNIQPNDWRERTAFYKKFGFKIIWIFDSEAFGKMRDDGYIKVPGIFIYLRTFYPIYLLDTKNITEIKKLILGERKQEYVPLTIEYDDRDDGLFWHVIDQEWVEDKEGYYKTLKTVFEFTFQNLTWQQLLTKGENTIE